MSYNRKDGSDNEFDIQALLDKYLPEEDTRSTETAEVVSDGEDRDNPENDFFIADNAGAPTADEEGKSFLFSDEVQNAAADDKVGGSEAYENTVYFDAVDEVSDKNEADSPLFDLKSALFSDSEDSLLSTLTITFFSS